MVRIHLIQVIRTLLALAVSCSLPAAAGAQTDWGPLKWTTGDGSKYRFVTTEAQVSKCLLTGMIVLRQNFLGMRIRHQCKLSDVDLSLRDGREGRVHVDLACRGGRNCIHKETKDFSFGDPESVLLGSAPKRSADEVTDTKEWTPSDSDKTTFHDLSREEGTAMLAALKKVQGACAAEKQPPKKR